MKMKLLSMFIVLFASAAFADHQPGHMDDQEGMGKEKKVEQLASELNLTEDQKTKIQASREKYKSQISSMETAFTAAREKFMTTVENPNASTAELESAYKQKEDAQRNLQDTIFKSRMEFREVLTPEQRTKMISKRDDKMDKKHDRREKYKDWKQDKKEKRDAAAPTPAPVK